MRLIALWRRKRIITVQDTPPSDSHYWRCHPDDGIAPNKPVGVIPQDTEPCWHCGTLVDWGCYCLTCNYYTFLVPPGNVFHCKGCGRWWAYMSGANTGSIMYSGSD